MDIEQLRQEWAGRDSRLEQGIRMNSMLLRENLLEKGRLNIRRHGSPGVLGMIVGIGIIVWLGAFNAAHFLQWRFFVPGVMLHVWMVVSFALQIYQREQLRQIDYARPVVKLQSEFETLRIQRLRTVKWLLLTGQLVWWVPFFIVLFKGLFGVDLFALSPFMPKFLLYNVIASLLVVLLGNRIAQWIHARFDGGPKYRKFVDDIAGPDIAAAREFLTMLARFEDEGSAR